MFLFWLNRQPVALPWPLSIKELLLTSDGWRGRKGCRDKSFVISFVKRIIYKYFMVPFTVNTSIDTYLLVGHIDIDIVTVSRKHWITIYWWSWHRHDNDCFLPRIDHLINILPVFNIHFLWILEYVMWTLKKSHTFWTRIIFIIHI